VNLCFKRLDSSSRYVYLIFDGFIQVLLTNSLLFGKHWQAPVLSHFTLILDRTGLGFNFKSFYFLVQVTCLLVVVMAWDIHLIYDQPKNWLFHLVQSLWLNIQESSNVAIYDDICWFHVIFWGNYDGSNDHILDNTWSHEELGLSYLSTHAVDVDLSNY
jgi:hypothetical protein